MTILVGAISGLVASIIFFVVLYRIKPRIEISDLVTIEKTDEGTFYRVKVVNKTHAMITNLRYTLYYCKEHQDKLVTMNEIPSKNVKLVCIAPYSKKDKLNEYAVRFKYEVDPNMYPMEEGCKLVFYFLADHAVSNTTVCIRKTYYVDDVRAGVFERADSLNVISTLC